MQDLDEDSNPHSYSLPNNVIYKTWVRFTIFALIVNIILASTKVIEGIVGHSHVVLADEIHSATDSFSTGLVHAAVVIAQKPKDKNYHFGYGKIESIVFAFIGMVLVGIWSYLIYSSILLLPGENYQNHRWLTWSWQWFRLLPWNFFSDTECSWEEHSTVTRLSRCAGTFNRMSIHRGYSNEKGL